jgi:hypothetical protein
MTMPRFILEPSATATWQRAVQEAARETVTELDEDRESYLVFLLMRYLRTADLLRAVLALEFLESFEKPRRHRCDALRRVGDQCLVIAGLFPEQAARGGYGCRISSTSAAAPTAASPRPRRR